MAPLIFLFGTFAVLYFADRYVLDGRLGRSFIGRASMAVMLIVTGVAHFTNTQEMVEIMPDAIPAKAALVYFTGVCELLAVVGLVWNRTSRLASILLIVLFIAVLPANIAGSLKSVQFGGMEYGPLYLLFRVPVQILFIWWVCNFGLRKNVDRPE